MESLLQEHFDLHTPSLKQLNGYDNLNYLVKDRGSNFIFKTYPYNPELLEVLKAETEVLLHLNEFEVGEFPKPIPFKNEQHIRTLNVNGKKTLCRMLSYIDGDFLGATQATFSLAESLATLLANLDKELQSFTHTALKGRQWEWDLQYLHLNEKYLDAVDPPHIKSVVSYFLQQFKEQVVPVYPTLRKQTIYNDANEWNIIVKDGKASGLIDFGDLAHSFLINEVAIAATYLSYDKKDPLEWITTFLKAYHKVLPLEKKEISILYYLIGGRLCTSILNAAYSKKAHPENDYATSSEQHAWSLLQKWLEIGPIKAQQSFERAVGLKAVGLKSESVVSTSKKLEWRHKNISKILSISYKDPVVTERAAFQYMYDAYGNTYLDAYNNIPHVGHSHPKVVNAGQRQMAKLNTNTRYLYDLLPLYAERLLEKFPRPLNKVFFVNSGSAASDLALRLVEAHTGSNSVMVMEHGYHGNTQLAIDSSDYKFSHARGRGQKEHISKVPLPDTYRGQYRAQSNAGSLYATDAIDMIKKSQRAISAFISEPIVGCGGQVPLAQGYLKELYPFIRKQGGLCISDEVQTGFGRLGAHFWGFEMHDVIPDIVILGKPMGNGHPIGAVVCTDAVAESFEEGVEFFSSFGGNPVSCAIGLSVLEVIKEEHLQENAHTVGRYYMDLLKDLQKKYPCIGDVRGAGLFIGIDIVKGPHQEPDTVLAQHIKNELRDRHILVSTDGPYDNVIKSKPPLCFSKANAEKVVTAIDEILKIGIP